MGIILGYIKFSIFNFFIFFFGGGGAEGGWGMPDIFDILVIRSRRWFVLLLYVPVNSFNYVWTIFLSSWVEQVLC